jgi:hypothetical protein
MLILDRHKGGCGHASEPIMVKEVRSELSDSGLSGEDPFSESGITKFPTEISWVVGRELFFVNRLEHSAGLGLGAHQISARCSFFSQFGLSSTF